MVFWSSIRIEIRDDDYYNSSDKLEEDQEEDRKPWLRKYLKCLLILSQKEMFKWKMYMYITSISTRLEYRYMLTNTFLSDFVFWLH